MADPTDDPRLTDSQLDVLYAAAGLPLPADRKADVWAAARDLHAAAAVLRSPLALELAPAFPASPRRA